MRPPPFCWECSESFARGERRAYVIGYDGYVHAVHEDCLEGERSTRSEFDLEHEPERRAE